MERSCSCAEPQAFSAEACGLCSPEALFSNSLFTWFQNRFLLAVFFGLACQKQMLCQQNPFTACFQAPGLPVRKQLRHLATGIYLNRKNSPPNVSDPAGRLATALSLAASVSLKSTRDLLGQHINSCSRLIHSCFWPIKSS